MGKDFVEVIMKHLLVVLTPVFQSVNEFVQKIRVMNRDQGVEQPIQIILIEIFVNNSLKKIENKLLV